MSRYVHPACGAGDPENTGMADPLAENANASDAQYNRVPTTEELEDIWKTGTPLSDNIYIMFPNNAD